MRIKGDHYEKGITQSCHTERLTRLILQVIWVSKIPPVRNPRKHQWRVKCTLRTQQSVGFSGFLLEKLILFPLFILQVSLLSMSEMYSNNSWWIVQVKSYIAKKFFVSFDFTAKGRNALPWKMIWRWAGAGGHTEGRLTWLSLISRSPGPAERWSLCRHSAFREGALSLTRLKPRSCLWAVLCVFGRCEQACSAERLIWAVEKQEQPWRVTPAAKSLRRQKPKSDGRGWSAHHCLCRGSKPTLDCSAASPFPR